MLLYNKRYNSKIMWKSPLFQAVRTVLSDHIVRNHNSPNDDFYRNINVIEVPHQVATIPTNYESNASLFLYGYRAWL